MEDMSALYEIRTASDDRYDKQRRLSLVPYVAVYLGWSSWLDRVESQIRNHFQGYQ